MGQYTMWIFLGIMVLLLGGMWFFNSRRYKKQQQEREDKMNSLAVGDKVVTIGMWIGEIIAINDDGTYLLKTGNDEFSGYVTIQQAAIYQILKDKEPEFAEPVVSESDATDNSCGADDPFAEEKTSDDTDVL